MNNTDFFSQNILLIIGTAITVISLVLTYLGIRKQILTYCVKIGKGKPFEIYSTKQFIPLNAIIRNPNNSLFFNDQLLPNNVIYPIDSIYLDILNLTTITMKINPKIVVQVFEIDEVTDLPVIVLPEPQQGGFGGGGGNYENFSTKLPSKTGTYFARQSSSTYSLFDIDSEKQLHFVVDIEFEPGFYYWFKVGISYSIRNRERIQWVNQLFFSGNPKAMRIWLFHEDENYQTILRKTDKIFINKDYLGGRLLDISSDNLFASEEGEVGYSYGK